VKDWQSRKTKEFRTNSQACYFTVLRQHLSIPETVNAIRSPNDFCPYGGK